MSEDEQPDDTTIPHDAILWRRIPPGQDWAVFDTNQNKLRPTSKAFQNYPNMNAMSVFLAVETVDPLLALEGHIDYSLAWITAELVRRFNQRIVRVTSNVPGHAHVIGDKPQPVRSALAKEADWVIPPVIPPAL